GRVLETTASGSPYRADVVATRVAEQAPRLVHLAALTGVVLGSAIVPGVSYAMATMHFDGIALSLLPSMGSAAAVWYAGLLLIGRAPLAVEMAKLATVVSTVTHIALPLLAFLHVAAARAGWSDRESLGYVDLAIALALVALPQSALLKAAVKKHADKFVAERASAGTMRATH
ncbi:MAG TPA: hypothetical protein VGY54_07180, partial [Polyangiaceae bacterium]|nr:hypothetical protein [Polyangiaceae bacterium]